MKAEVLAALGELHAEHGVLRAQDVVDAARDTESVLHAEVFRCSADEAANNWYLEEARRLIRVAVTEQPELGQPVRVFVSLPSDRKVPGGGYRRLTDVIAHDQMRAELLQAALDDLRSAKERHKHVRELTEVFAAIDAADAKHSRKRNAA
jgi:hypothetical protein